MHTNPRKPVARQPEPAHLNFAVVIGSMTNEPVQRVLADGTTIAQFDVSTSLRDDDRSGAVSVPVAWRDPPPASIDALTPGTTVVVTGRVVRRFFRTGGATQTRTELVVDRCFPARRTKRLRSLLEASSDLLGRHCR